jgi:ATP-dependent Clp protease ATP-binding subunit ClpA
MQLAKQNAQRFNHRSIDTGHLLLALAEESGTPTSLVLSMTDATPVSLQEEFLKLRPIGPPMVLMGKLSKADDLVPAVKLAFHEADRLRHKMVDSEHLFLGILAARGIGVTILSQLGADLRQLKRELLHSIGDHNASA